VTNELRRAHFFLAAARNPVSSRFHFHELHRFGYIHGSWVFTEYPRRWHCMHCSSDAHVANSSVVSVKLSALGRDAVGSRDWLRAFWN
jgi:hypothetical protein